MTGQTIGRKELLGATDAEIETAVAQADAILLRGLLYLINGDEEAAAIPQSTSAADFRGPLPTIVDPGHVARLRRKAVDFLKSYRDAGAPNLPVATDRLNRAMDLVLGVQIPEDERPMWIEQMGLDPMARSFEWDGAYPDDRNQKALLLRLGRRRRYGGPQFRHAAQERRYPLRRDREEWR